MKNTNKPCGHPTFWWTLCTDLPIWVCRCGASWDYVPDEPKKVKIIDIDAMIKDKNI